jgi:hypothetical protein
MCKEQCQCANPERLVGIIKECSPEQIKECHGGTKFQPCAENSKKPEEKKKA